MLRTVASCVALALTGCDAVFDLDHVSMQPDATTVDAKPPRPMFGPPVLVAEVSGGLDDDDPSVTDDQLELFFGSYRGTGFDSDVWVSTRSTVMQPWGAPIQVADVNDGGDDNTPRVTGNGLVLLFVKLVNTKYDIHQSQRLARNMPWSAGTPVAGLNTEAFHDYHPVVTRDGLALYFTSTRAGSNDIFVATRSLISDPWGEPIPIDSINTAFDEEGPFTLDGTTLYFTTNRPGSFGNQDLWVATRSHTDQPFLDPEPLDELNTLRVDEDAWLSPDETTIWFASTRNGDNDYDIFTASRIP